MGMQPNQPRGKRRPENPFDASAKICTVSRKELFQPRKTQAAELGLGLRWLVTLDKSPGTLRCVQQHSHTPRSNVPGANSPQAAQQEPQKMEQHHSPRPGERGQQLQFK